MTDPNPDLPFDLTGSTVTEIDWPRRGFRMILGGKTADGRAVDGVRLTFEEVANLDPLNTFLTARLTYSRPSARMPYPEYHYTPFPLRLPTRLTHLRRSRAARASSPDPAYGTYYGAPPRAGRNQRLYLFTLAAARFRTRKPFPIVCARTALVAADGTALGGEETPIPPPLSVKVLKQLGRQFAEAVLNGNDAVANRLLTEAARRRLGRTGLNRLLPRGWAESVKYAGSRKKAAAMFRKHLTVEPQPGGEAADSISFAHNAPGVPPNSVRGFVVVYAGDPDWDIDPMCFLYFVGEGRDVRIAHAEPN